MFAVFQVHESQLDDAAIEFCARKVAAMTGDIRKALHMCRYVVSCPIGCVSIVN